MSFIGEDKYEGKELLCNIHVDGRFFSFFMDGTFKSRSRYMQFSKWKIENGKFYYTHHLDQEPNNPGVVMVGEYADQLQFHVNLHNLFKGEDEDKTQKE